VELTEVIAPPGQSYPGLTFKQGLELASTNTAFEVETRLVKPSADVELEEARNQAIKATQLVADQASMLASQSVMLQQLRDELEEARKRKGHQQLRGGVRGANFDRDDDRHAEILHLRKQLVAGTLDFYELPRDVQREIIASYSKAESVDLLHFRVLEANVQDEDRQLRFAKILSLLSDAEVVSATLTSGSSVVLEKPKPVASDLTPLLAQLEEIAEQNRAIQESNLNQGLLISTALKQTTVPSTSNPKGKEVVGKHKRSKSDHAESNPRGAHPVSVPMWQKVIGAVIAPNGTFIVNMHAIPKSPMCRIPYHSLKDCIEGTYIMVGGVKTLLSALKVLITDAGRDSVIYATRPQGMSSHQLNFRKPRDGERVSYVGYQPNSAGKAEFTVSASTILFNSSGQHDAPTKPGACSGFLVAESDNSVVGWHHWGGSVNVADAVTDELLAFFGAAARK